jgi:hypothetical protein
MRPSLRFLALAVLGWGGFRAASLGALPGAEIFQVAPSEAKPPPIVATEFPPIEPLPAASAGDASADLQTASFPYVQSAAAAPPARGVPVPVYYYAASPMPPPRRPTPAADLLPNPRPQYYSPIPVLDEWPLSSLAAMSMPPLRSTVTTPGQSVPVALKHRGIDRLQLTAWALLRAQSAGIAGTRSLAEGGSLGASQAGARLTYNFTRQIAATLRSSSDVGRRGGEVAAGVRIQPVAAIPIWIDAERRQRIGRYGGGRSAFALFFEGGVYGRPMPLHFLLDTYLQGGVVGLRQRDRFIDGALTLTRPVYKQFSAGFGVWGGAQPGVYRVDAGPRVTMRVRNNLRVHVDWRQRLAGNAQPGSGPAITLAGDF